jgi:hypothetical protein
MVKVVGIVGTCFSSFNDLGLFSCMKRSGHGLVKRLVLAFICLEGLTQPQEKRQDKEFNSGPYECGAEVRYSEPRRFGNCILYNAGRLSFVS